MEFFVVVLIFITCMIALALLIYYCQEKRNPKYSFTNNQKAISAIALSVGMPGLPSDIFKPSPYASLVVPYPPQPVQPGFVMAYPQPLPDPDDELSDSGSSSSSKIYFAPNTAAYSVAKRMSMKTKIERRMSAKPQSTKVPPDTLDAAAYLLASARAENPHRHKALNTSTSTPTPAQRNGVNFENIMPRPNSNSQNLNDSSDNTENRIRRSASPYIPASVIAFHKKNNSQSGSPYTPLRNEVPATLHVQSETSESPSAPNQSQRERSPIRSENLFHNDFEDQPISMPLPPSEFRENQSAPYPSITSPYPPEPPPTGFGYLSQMPQPCFREELASEQPSRMPHPSDYCPYPTTTVTPYPPQPQNIPPHSSRPPYSRTRSYSAEDLPPTYDEVFRQLPQMSERQQRKYTSESNVYGNA